MAAAKDLKGSLEDTKLKIIPSAQLTELLKTLISEDNLPENISKLVNGQYHKLGKTNGLIIEKAKYDFTDADIDILKKCIPPPVRVVSDELVLEEKDIPACKENRKANKKAKKIAKKTEDENDKDNKKSNEPFANGHVANGDVKHESNEKLKADAVETIPEFYLHTTDLDWLYIYLQNQRKTSKAVPYLHELLEGTEILTPNNKVIPRNPVLEARCVKLRAQQQTREYRAMTRTVDNVRKRFPDDSIAYQLKSMNRQLIAVGQFIISIFAGFLFGFKGIEWMIGELDFGFKLLLGVMCALIIALAEIYFLAKKLNEELNVPETTQIGGPPVFADQEERERKQKLHLD